MHLFHTRTVFILTEQLSKITRLWVKNKCKSSWCIYCSFPQSCNSFWLKIHFVLMNSMKWYSEQWIETITNEQSFIPSASTFNVFISQCYIPSWTLSILCTISNDLKPLPSILIWWIGRGFQAYKKHRKC